MKKDLPKRIKQKRLLTIYCILLAANLSHQQAGDPTHQKREPPKFGLGFGHDKPMQLSDEHLFNLYRSRKDFSSLSPTQTQNPDQKTRLLQAGDAEQSTRKQRAIRIQIDTSLAYKFMLQYPFFQSHYNMIKVIMDSVKDYLESHLEVYSLDYYSVPSLKCGGQTVKAFTSQMADHFLSVNLYSDPTKDIFSFTTLCTTENFNSRPISSMFTINLAHFSVQTDSYYNYFESFVHNTIHSLGFYSGMYGKFVDSNHKTVKESDIYSLETIGGVSRKVFKGSNTLKEARRYFGCDTLKGIPLEDDQGKVQGHHFEKAFFPTGMMSARQTNPGIITKFAFMVLLDSGWYKIRGNPWQRYQVGAGEGCSFFDSCSQKRFGYCNKAFSPITNIPDVNYTSAALCWKDLKLSNQEQCDMVIPQGMVCTKQKTSYQIIRSYNSNYQSELAVYGPGSRIFIFRNVVKNGVTFPTRPVCLLSHCIRNIVDSRQKAVQVQMSNGNIFTCTRPGVFKISDSSHLIECPDPDHFCNQFEKRCKNDCFGNGICKVDLKCYCFKFYSGSDCSIFSGYYYPPLTSYQSSYLYSEIQRNPGAVIQDNKQLVAQLIQIVSNNQMAKNAGSGVNDDSTGRFKISSANSGPGIYREMFMILVLIFYLLNK